MNLFASLAGAIRIPLSPLVLFVILALVFLGWIIYSVILRYHWKTYAYHKLDVIQMDIIYFVGSGVLLTAMAVTALMYSLSSSI